MKMTSINDRTVMFDNVDDVEIICNQKTYTVTAGQAVFFEDEGDYTLYHNVEGASVPERFDIKVTGRVACTDDGMVAINRQDQMKTVRDRIITRRDQEAEKIALQFITPGFRKIMSYQEKYRQALLYKADKTATVNLLKNEADTDGMTLAKKVDQILARRDAWEAAEILLNNAMTALKKDLDAAETMSEIENVDMQFQWPAELPVEVLS